MSDFLDDLDARTLRFDMLGCRAQEARRRKQLEPFACKPVGTVEFSELARAVDPRIETRCVTCPPDERHAASWCAWEFRLPAD